MTPVFQTSNPYTRSGHKLPVKVTTFFSVTIQDFDGEEFDIEVEGESYEEAARQAEARAAEMGCYNILNMFIYSF